MNSYRSNSATVHNHFSKNSFTFPKQVKGQVLLPRSSPDLLTGEVHRNECAFSRITPTHSIIDVQSPADKAAGSSVSSF
jgi:hypothetical protein